MVFGRRREAWVFLKGRRSGSAYGATVELVERGARGTAGPRGAGGAYAWVTFPETPYGDYTVQVFYPSGARQTGRLTVDQSLHSLTLEEPVSS